MRPLVYGTAPPLLVSVRVATTGKEVGWGFLPKDVDIGKGVFAEAEKYFRKKAPASGVAITIRAPL